MNQKQIRDELQRVGKLWDALKSQLAGSGDAIQQLEAVQPMVKPGTVQMDALLQSGYGISVADAKKIIKERDEDATRWPLEEYRKAEAVLAAYTAKPEPSSPKLPWRVRSNSRATTTAGG